MNEINLINPIQFSSNELNTATNRIVGYRMNARANMLAIAETVAEVDANEWYKADGFESAVDYVCKTFRFKKSQAYNMLAVGRIQCSEHPLSPAYSLSQAIEVARLTEDERVEALTDGRINEDMTVEELRDVVDEIHPRKARTVKAKRYTFTRLDTNECIADGATLEEYTAGTWGIVHTFKERGAMFVVNIRLKDSVNSAMHDTIVCVMTEHVEPIAETTGEA